MTHPDLARLYRRFTRDGAAAQPLPSIDALLALAEGEQSAETERLLADVGRSGMQADLLRFARALKAESALLGVEMEQAFEHQGRGHAHGSRRSRAAAAPRRQWLRISAGLAAGLLVAIGVWSVQHKPQVVAPVVAGASAQQHASPDRIFAALSDQQVQPGRAQGDKIFRSDFRRDQIFRSQFTDG